MRYRVRLSDDAKLELRGLSPGPRRAVNTILKRLRSGPDHSVDLLLEDQPDTWRARTGRWRVVFEIEPGRAIYVTRIRPRETAYEGIERPRRQ